MKTPVSLLKRALFFFLLNVSGIAPAQILGHYSFEGTTCANRNLTITTPDSLLTFDPFRWNNVTCSNAVDVLSTRDWNTSSEIDTTEYYSFRVGISPCYRISSATLSWFQRVSNATTNPHYFVRSSIDGFTNNLSDGVLTTINQRIQLPLLLDTSDISELEVRIYASAMYSATTTFRLDSVELSGKMKLFNGKNWYKDQDGDGLGWGLDSKRYCSQPTGYVFNLDDCNDTDSSVGKLPGSSYYFADNDEDGLGNPADSIAHCFCPVGYVDNNSDCNDRLYTDFQQNTIVCYRDADADGFGVREDSLVICTLPVGYSLFSGDCNDSDSTIHPGATEILNNGIDEDCSGSDALKLPVQLATYTFTGHKCATPNLRPNISDSMVWFGEYQLNNVNCASGTNYLTTNNWNAPSAALIWKVAPLDCKNVQLTKLRFQHRGSTSAGTATIELRSSYDNYTTLLGSWQIRTPGQIQTDSLLFPPTFITNDTTRFQWKVHGITSKSATYRQDNILIAGIINDRPAFLQYRDNDGDGYGDSLNVISNCKTMNGYVTNSMDCNDQFADIHPATIWYADRDGDGFGTVNERTVTCQQPLNFVLDSTDCDDANDRIYPGAFDVSGNTLDENCDGVDGAVSLVENLEEIVEIIPNPGTGYCILRWKGKRAADSHLTIATMDGQIVYNDRVNPDIYEMVIPTSTWTNGVYLFNLTCLQMNKQYVWIKI